MKNQIRNSVFETNSSSVHTISISKYTEDTNKPAMLTAKLGKFGWEHELYDDPISKLSYLWTAVCCFADHDAWDKEKDFVKHAQVLEDWKKFISDPFENYGITIEFEHPAPFSWDYYIDHSEELRDMFNDFSNNPELIVDFVLSNNSNLETYNDNDDYEVLAPDANYKYVFDKGN